MYSIVIQFIALFSLAGFAIPCLFTAIWILLGKSRDLYISIGGKLEILQLLTWPSSLFMIATAGHEGIDYQMLAIAIVANVLLYALIGFLLWWGINRQRWLLYAVIGTILVGWYKLLTL